MYWENERNKISGLFQNKYITFGATIEAAAAADEKQADFILDADIHGFGTRGGLKFAVRRRLNGARHCGGQECTCVNVHCFLSR